MNAKIEKLFLKVFAEKNLQKFEKFILFFATAGFIIHLTLILLNNNGVLNISFGSDTLLQNPISAIYTPFSFILVYEAFLLIYYLPRSFTTSVGKQYEIMSLILIRKIFKDIPEVNLDANWLINQNNVQLIYDLSGILLVFFLILIFRKLKERLPQLSVNKNLERFINYKRIISLILVPVLTTLCLISFFDWYNGVFSNQPFDDNLNYLFFVDFFTILILVDVFILLISFQYTERYSQLIRNTGFIISTILLRLSFSATGITSIILLVSGIAFGIIILAIYNQMEKVPKIN
ncbi:MAG: hypothetical protein VXX96_04635 [Bacteroidota bacterium]|nr:hypothetical protein [Bacteroidota bacterium]MEC8602464.1 hypothetical protein [Bacteroidota bacterium]